MNDHERRMLTAWFDANEVRGSDAALDRALTATHGKAQRPGWLVRLRGGTIAADEPRRISLAVPVLGASVLIAALVIGALVGGLVTPPPTASPASPSLTPALSPTLPTVLGGRKGLVAFTHVELVGECPQGRPPSLCIEERLWVASPDGSNAHPLVPTVAGPKGRQIALGWSPDDRLLLFEADGIPTLTDASGSEVRPLNALRSNTGSSSFAFSPDSRRLAFLRQVRADDTGAGTELAILDLASGAVISFDSTRSTDFLDGVQWSPDGQWIAYERQVFADPAGSKIFIIRPDGTDRRALTTKALPAFDPHWSPDGSNLAFTATAGDRLADLRYDIYRLQLNGGDPVRLTTDGISARPSWTLDGRIVFNRDETENGIDLWVMAGDGSDVQHLDRSSLAALSEIGCVVCIYPPSPAPSDFFFDHEAFWQPSQ